jgi:hypothetical protein
VTNPRQQLLQVLYNNCGTLVQQLRNGGFDRFREILLDNTEEGPVIIPSASDAKLMRIVSGILEIESALNRMKSASIFLGEIKSCPQGLSYVAYLKYHLDSALQSSYIFRERVETFAKRTARSYRKSSLFPLLDAWSAKHSTALDNMMRGVIEIRGEHVHENDYVDKDLALLSMSDTFLRTSIETGLLDLPSDFEDQLKSLTEKSAKRKSKLFLELVEALDGWLDRMFKELLTALSGDDGQLKLP